MIFRRRKPRRAYIVQTHDWPVGVGTRSESLSREARYAALNEVGGDEDQPVVVGEDKP